jgi:DNA mismatch repair ATPase MutS
VVAHLKQLEFRRGVLVSAELGTGNNGINYVLRRPGQTKRTWFGALSGESRISYTFRISDRDEAGARAMGELRDRGINLAANALAQSVDHILSFFLMLRRELAFYVGCLRVDARLTGKGEPLCTPRPLRGESGLMCRELYDVCLSLRSQERVTGNDVEAPGTNLVMITGANQGGKSTFLRSVGIAQLMMQAGMQVPAESFAADIRTRILTHYKREEDSAMNSGKLDEELKRMSEIVDQLVPGSLVLFNESFAATNEREGSEIARQVVRGLLETGVKVFFVTHLFDLAQSCYERHEGGQLFLRAERHPGGRRTFRVMEGRPLPTSYGRDLYDRIFAGPAAASTRTAVGSGQSPDGRG